MGDGWEDERRNILVSQTRPLAYRNGDQRSCLFLDSLTERLNNESKTGADVVRARR